MAGMEEEYLDVLQNIELGIVKIYRADQNLIDADALDAVDALIRHYGAEENGRRPPEHRLASGAAGAGLCLREGDVRVEIGEAEVSRSSGRTGASH